MSNPNGAGGAGGAERLPCGAVVDDLVDQVADGRVGDLDDHQRSCTHCRAFLAETDSLWAPVRALAAEPVRAPADLLEKVMDAVRDLAREAWHLLLPDRAGQPGVTRIAARVLARIARRAAARVPGVSVALGRSTESAAAAATEQATSEHRQPGSAIGVAGQRTVIDLAIAATYGVSIPAVADQVRATVRTDLSHYASVEDAQINIFVTDVLTD